MASIRSLWTGLVVLGVLGVLGVLQMGAQAQVSMQPDFQQDKVARSSAVLHRPERHVEGSRQRRARGRIPHRHSPALAPELRDSNPFCPLAPLRGAKASPPGKELGGRWLFFWTQTWLQGKRLVLRFMGRWFSAGLASNSSWFREKKATMSMCSTVVALSADGGLNLTSTFLRKDQCETRTMQLQPTGTPGSYSYHSPRWGRTSLISVVEINYDEYALVDTKGVDHDFRMATLYSRTQTPRAELKEKFSTFCEAQGFTEDTIVFLPQTDKCLKEEE